ncbi:MAG: hypothetical protein IKO49_08410 [Bacilli bacterium]|nr:hypothetical protein [Bacilli bacterium]
MNKKIRLVLVFLLIILCIAYTIKTFDSNNDMFYLIKLGKDIVNNGIDFRDHYSWVAEFSYSYPHWLFSVYIYLVYYLFGFLGIYISNIISFILLILCVYFVNLKVSKSEFMSFFISLLSIVALAPFVVARGQVFSTILLLLEVYYINKLIETGSKKYIVHLAIISLLIANIHATIWLMVFILFLPFVGEDLVYKIMYKKRHKDSLIIGSKVVVEKVKNSKLVFIAILICLLMGLLSPSRICYTYVFKTMFGDSQTYIVEHQNLVPISYPLFLLTMFLLYFVNTKIKLRELFMIFGIVVLSLISMRHLIFFYTVGFLYVSLVFIRQLNDNGDHTLDILEKMFFYNKYILSLIVILSLGLCVYKINTNLKKDYISNKDYPISAVKYIKNNLDYKNIKLYNNYNIGSYLLFNDIGVFIDSRCDLYFKEFNNIGLDLFDEVIDINKNYEKVFSKYGVNYVLLSKNDILYYIIRKDNNYEEIYQDKYFVIYKGVNDAI